MTELELDYLSDPNVWYVDIIAKAAKISGSGTARTAYPWVITQAALPDLFLDADGTAPAVSGHIRAGSPDGSVQYPLHIVKLTLNNNPALSVVEIWVNTGTVDADDATGVPIRIFWNKSGKSQPAVGASYGQYAVYNTEFAYWYHGNDDPSDGLTDSTDNVRASTDLGTMTSGDQVAAKVGDGIDFDGSNDGIQITTSDFPNAGTDFTYGRWVKPRTDSGFPNLATIEHSTSTLSGLIMDWEHSTKKFRFVVANTGWTDDAGAISTTVFTFNTNFYFVVGRFDDSLFESAILVNGVNEDTDTATGTRFTKKNTNEYIGSGRFNNAQVDACNGILDEMWRFDGYIADDDIATMYQNQNDPANFWDHSAVEKRYVVLGFDDVAVTGFTLTIDEGDHVTFTFDEVSVTGFTLTVNDPVTINLGFDDVAVTGFALTVDTFSITSVTPTEAIVGTEITIVGGGFTGASSVTLNGVELDFVVVSATEITFTVPEGATSGDIVITVGASTETYSVFGVLPLVPADGYHIEIYRIQANVGETDIEIVDGTYKQYFTEGLNEEIDFIPISFSDFVRSVETEEGVYSLGSVDMSIEGLPADYFNDYTEYIFEPFIIVIRNAAGTTLFHGPIDPDTAVYDAGTRITAIRGLSWEVLLEATNSPCRYIYETVFTRDYSDAWFAGQNSTLYVKAEINGQDMTEIVQAGAVMVFDTPAGEHRSVVIGTTVDDDDLAVLINAPPTNYLLKDHEVEVADISVISNVVSFVIANASLWSQLEQVENGQNMSFVVQNPTTQKLFVLGTTDTYPLNGSNAVFVLDSDRLTIKVIFSLPTVEVTDVIDTPFISILSEGFVSAGESVRILGPDVYGYAPTGILSIFRPYDIDGGVLQGLFALPELGVLPYIVDTFDFPVDYDRSLEKWIELPPRLLEALRQIQNTHYTFLNLEPRSEGGLPRITVIVRPRVAINTTDVPIVADVTNIISFRENAADLTPRAVIVKSHINYFEPSESVETVGFYYDGVDSADPKITGKPFGPRTVEITVNISPSYTGEFFFGDGPIVRNDEKLKAIAKQFYNFYKGLARPCDFVVYGYPNEDWLGKFITISEIDDPLLETIFERAVFVTEVSVDPNTNTTSVRGRIGTYTDEEDGDPVVVVSGLLVWTDWDNSGDEQVVLSAIQSYDPQGDPITVTWYDGATLLATGFTLIHTFDVGQYDITVRVTDTDANFTEEILDLRVVAFVLFSPTSEDDLALSYVTNGTFVPSNTAPTGSADTTGSLGEIRFDDTYVYVKTSAGWKRSALSTF